MESRQQSTAWTVTLLYAGCAVGLGIVLPRVETRLLPTAIVSISVPAAMAVYSSVASGMIALTAIVFSLTFVMVQFSATAYSPRLVLWFARDPLLTHAFGLFTATFLYALFALAWVDRRGTTTPVPVVSAILVLVLLIASVIVFAGLVQRVTLLQITRTLAFTGDQGRNVIDSIYQERSHPLADVGEDIPDSSEPAQVVLHDGPPRVVERVNAAWLVELASASQGVITVSVAVGDTVFESTPLLRVSDAIKPIDERQLRKGVVLGLERTFEQDPKYAIRLLVDIAIRALSPAVNDPTTAVQALDQIGDLLLRLARRNLEIGAIRDAGGVLRVLIPFPSWDDFLQLAFGEICAYGATSIQVMRRMNALIADLRATIPEERRPALEYWRTRLRSSVASRFGDSDDRVIASIADRQGLGVSHRP